MKKIILIIIATASMASAGEFAVHRGMSKAQVRAACGNPSQISTDKGKVQWIYIRMHGYNFIPIVGALRGPSVLSVVFNDSGKVASYETDN